MKLNDYEKLLILLAINEYRNIVLISRYTAMSLGKFGVVTKTELMEELNDLVKKIQEDE